MEWKPNASTTTIELAFIAGQSVPVSYNVAVRTIIAGLWLELAVVGPTVDVFGSSLPFFSLNR
jgi:hypothetical protein